MYNCSATYSCISDSNDIGDPNTTHNINSNPLFVDDANNDYHIDINSPCIDAGDPNYIPYEDEKDIDGEQRVMGGRIDMGADEVKGNVHNLHKDWWYVHIQDAIDYADNGDRIEVGLGTYNENIDFSGKAITLRSASPLSWDVVRQTVIEGTGTDSVVTFDNGEGSGSILHGFTITGGYDYQYGGGGIYCSASSPVISNCIITENEAMLGGQICCNNSAILVKNCIISKHINYTSGIHLSNSPNANVINCTIVDNHVGILAFASSSVVISSCILWDNAYSDLSGCSATYSCIEDDDDEPTNIHSNPCFVNPSENDYRIESNSPCIDKGNPYFEPTGGKKDIEGEPRVYGSRVDMGADEWISAL